MLNKPLFKDCYIVEKIEPDQVFILSERDAVLLSDRIYYLLASLIDGHRDAELIEKWKILY